MPEAERYSIEIETEHASGPTGRAWVEAVERLPSGLITETFGPVADADQAAGCLAAAPR